MQLASLFSSAWAIAAMIALFGGSIFIHELEHFLAAKRRGLYIQRFSIGFGPKIFGWKKDGVEYRISLLPFGGYVALPQLADMRGIEGQLDIDPSHLKPISYADKMIVAVMGAVFNVFFALALALVIWKVGYPVSSVEQSTTIGFIQESFQLEDGTVVESPAKREGLQMGDKIISVDGSPVDNWTSLRQSLVVGTGTEADGRRVARLTLIRNGEEMDLSIHPEISGNTGFRHLGIAPAVPVIVDTLFDDPNAPAVRVGIKPYDEIVKANGSAVHSHNHFYNLLSDNTGKTIELEIKRGEDTFRAAVDVVNVQYTTRGDTIPSIGIAKYYYDTYPIYPDPLDQIKRHITMTFQTLKALIHPDSEISLKHMSGPVGISRVLYATTVIDFRIALWFTVLININLAIFNLLPIPVLDGGHMLFATISKLRKRPLPPNFITGTQGAFMILLFGLMIYVSGHDISRWVGDSQDATPSVEYIDPVFPEKEASEAE